MSDEPNSTELRARRRDTFAAWLDSMVPASMQRLVVNAILLAVLAKVGIDVTGNGQQNEKIIENQEQMMGRVFGELLASSRTNWQARGNWQSNILVEINGRLERLEARP